jgi:hypothetical protein
MRIFGTIVLQWKKACVRIDAAYGPQLSGLNYFSARQFYLSAVPDGDSARRIIVEGKRIERIATSIATWSPKCSQCLFRSIVTGHSDLR